MRRLTLLVVMASAFAAGGVLVAQQQQQQQQPPPQQQQPPVIRSGISFVRVDALVTDRKTGKPITDLKPEDFEITEDRKPQTIETFRLVDMEVPVVGEMADAAPIRSLDQQEREMQREDVRVIAILLDDYHVRRGNDMAIREKLASFVMQLNPRDLVAIFYPLTPVSTAVFSRNHESMANALMRFEGRKFDYTPRNPYEEKYSMYPAQTVEYIRAQVSLSALRALAIHLGTLREGRKAILFVSEGMTYNIPSSLENPQAFMTPGSAARAGSMGITQNRSEFSNQVEMVSDLRYVFDAASRSNTAIYTIDPRGLAVGEYDINQRVTPDQDRDVLRDTTDSLRILADNTGGRAIVGRNDFLGGLRQMLQDNSSYYLLGYNSTQSPTDGRFHEIRVRVKRPNAEVRARKGYWALTADDAKRAEAGPSARAVPAEINEALSALAAPRRGRPALTWIGTSRLEDGKTQVSVIWEVPGSTGATGSTGSTGSSPEQVARVSITASSSKGDLFFRGRADAQPDAPGRPRGGVATFAAPPGPLDLRIQVEGAEGQVLDSETRTVTVPDYTTGIAIGTPQLFRARTARDITALKADASARPVAAREFSRTERLLLRFNAWGGGGAAPVVKARLLNMKGDPIAELPAPTPGPAGAFELDIPLSGYAPNDYVIELTTGDGAGAARVLTAIRIQ